MDFYVTSFWFRFSRRLRSTARPPACLPAFVSFRFSPPILWLPLSGGARAWARAKGRWAKRMTAMVMARPRPRMRLLPGHKIIASMSWVRLALGSFFRAERVCFTSMCLKAHSYVCVCTGVRVCTHPLVGFLFFPVKTKSLRCEVRYATVRVFRCSCCVCEFFCPSAISYATFFHPTSSSSSACALSTSTWAYSCGSYDEFNIHAWILIWLRYIHSSNELWAKPDRSYHKGRREYMTFNVFGICELKS